MNSIEWVVLLDGELWSDRFDQEWECVEHINEESKKLDIDADRFNYRRMTNEEVAKYYTTK